MEQQAQAWAVYQRLIEHFGEPPWQPPANPSAAVIDELIQTILSANTNDVNSGRAFAQLRAQFGADWDAVRTADLDAIKAAIRPAGMYNQKAPNLVATLAAIKRDHPDYDLSGLATLPVAEALAYLTALPGVGHKTASIVLLFCFNRAAFPVDTHIQRISQRLGIGTRRSSPAQLKVLWEHLLPPHTYYALHLNLIRHGREICDARQPSVSAAHCKRSAPITSTAANGPPRWVVKQTSRQVLNELSTCLPVLTLTAAHSASRASKRG